MAENKDNIRKLNLRKKSNASEDVKKPDITTEDKKPDNVRKLNLRKKSDTSKEDKAPDITTEDKKLDDVESNKDSGKIRIKLHGNYNTLVVNEEPGDKAKTVTETNTENKRDMSLSKERIAELNDLLQNDPDDVYDNHDDYDKP